MLEPSRNVKEELRRSRELIEEIRKVVELSKIFKQTVIDRINNRRKRQVLERVKG